MCKNNLVLIIIILCFNITKAQQKDYIILSGKIDNPNSDSLVIEDNKGNLLQVIKLSKNHTFKDTIRVSENIYIIEDGSEMTNLYLKPGYVLDLYINAKEFDESIKWKGIGSGENNYIAEKSLLKESLGRYSSYFSYVDLPEKKYLHITDSVYQLNLNLLEKYNKNIDSNFYFNEKKSLEFKMLEKIINYQGINRYLTSNDTFKVSENYPNPYLNINLNDEKLINNEDYITYLGRYYNDKTSNIWTIKDSFDYNISYLKIINKEISNPKIKEKLAVAEINKMNYTKNLDEFYFLIKSMLNDKEHIDELNALYKDLQKIQKGNISPQFEFADMDGKMVSLESLKGSYVYIDIWATWCGPCILEIPKLLKLEEEFKDKNIKFVSICSRDNKESWEKNVIERKLKGIQLFAPDFNDPFFKQYLVDGIPHFILIDKEGKIIDAKADRPSTSSLKPMLEDLLKN